MGKAMTGSMVHFLRNVAEDQRAHGFPDTE
jgi:hypothetical protein